MPDYFVQLAVGPGQYKTIHRVGGPCDHLRIDGQYHSLGWHETFDSAQSLAGNHGHGANRCPVCCNRRGLG